MAYTLSEKQYASIIQLDDQQRFDYFCGKVTRFEEIWSLSDNNGWVELSDEDGQICLPIWPHPDFAAAWATDDWSDCKPKAIPLEVWLERWTAGLQEDDTVLATFPVDNGQGLILTPEELHDALLSALDSGQ